MTKAVMVRVRDNGTFMWLKNLPARTKRITKRDGWNLVRKGASLLKESAVEARVHHFDKVLLTRNGIRPVKVKEATYGIEMPLYGLAVDRMKPHWVSLKPGRKITRWAKEKGISARAIKVHSHPYVNRGYRRMLRHANILINRTAEKIVRG